MLVSAMLPNISIRTKLKICNRFLVTHSRGSASRKVDDCARSAYTKAKESLSNTPVPVYSLPGNFDWPVRKELLIIGYVDDCA